jgi:hypothetical protein
VLGVLEELQHDVGVVDDSAWSISVIAAEGGRVR